MDAEHRDVADANASPPSPSSDAVPTRAARLALLAGAILLLYAPVLLQEYAFTDDWSHLAAADAHAVAAGPMIAGRPLYALALVLGFPPGGALASLATLRLVAVLGLAAFAWILHRHLERKGWPPSQSLCVAAAGVALPGPMLFAAWATCFPFPWAMTLGGLAFVVAERASGLSRRAELLSLAAATLLLTAAFLTYQPAAPVFWAFFAASFFAPGAIRRVRMAVHSALVFGVSAGLGLVSVQIGKALFPAARASRTALARDPLGKAVWFLANPLVEAWNLVVVHRSIALAAVIGALTAAGLALASRRAGIPWWVGVAAGAALLVGAYAPNLVVAENFASFRSEASLTMTAFLLAAIALRELARLLPRPEQVTTPALAVVAGIFVLAASSTLQRYLVRPHAIELSWLRGALSEPASRVLVVPRGMATLAPDIVHDELGFPSLVTDWSARAMIRVVVRERGLPVPQVVFPDGTNAAEFYVAPGTAVVDTQGLVRMRPDYRP